MSGWALALNFSEKQGFKESNLITADHVEKPANCSSVVLESPRAVLSRLRTPLEQPHFTSAEMTRQRGAPPEF
jgi:hypothetical protein